MIYIRGNRVDYDGWRDADGCTGRGYLDVLPYFLRAEDQQRGDSPYHGTRGAAAGGGPALRSTR
jgi:choline dehydrogenase